MPSPSAAVTDAMPSSISCLARSIGMRVHARSDGSGCGCRCVWPASRTLRTPSGLALAMRPISEEGRLDALRGENFQNLVAVAAAAGRRRRSAPPRDRRAAASRRYCMVPIRGCSRGSTTSVREVPSASGWPGQSAADAVCRGTAGRASPGMKAADDRVRTPANALPTMKHRLHSDLRREIITHGAMNAALI